MSAKTPSVRDHVAKMLEARSGALGTVLNDKMAEARKKRDEQVAECVVVHIESMVKRLRRLRNDEKEAKKRLDNFMEQVEAYDAGQTSELLKLIGMSED